MAEWLTTKEAAAYLKVHPKTVYRYVKSGRLRQYQAAGVGRPRFNREDLDALLRGLRPLPAAAGQVLEQLSTHPAPGEREAREPGAALESTLGQRIEALVESSGLSPKEKEVLGERLLVLARELVALLKAAEK